MGRPTRVAVVFNPAAGGGDPASHGRDTMEALEAAGLEVLWLETTREDPGQGLTAKAVAEGVELVMAQGGDGTVMACVTSLAGTEVPLAVLQTRTMLDWLALAVRSNGGRSSRRSRNRVARRRSCLKPLST